MHGPTMARSAVEMSRTLLVLRVGQTAVTARTETGVSSSLMFSPSMVNFTDFRSNPCNARCKEWRPAPAAV